MRDDTDADGATDADDADDASDEAERTGNTLVFEGTEPFARRRRPPALRLALIVLPILLAFALIVASLPSVRAVLLSRVRGQPLSFTVFADVPWASLRVDGGAAQPFVQDAFHPYPAAALILTPGRHQLDVTATGFLPLHAVIEASVGGSNQFVAHPRLSPDGAHGVLATINATFTSVGYAGFAFSANSQLVSALWPALGLKQQPTGAALEVRDTFEAPALDPRQPTFLQTNYLRPIQPLEGAVGVAVIVQERVRIASGCATTPAAERLLPVISGDRGEVIVSVRHATDGWHALNPYALRPGSTIYSSPDQAAMPATFVTLQLLAARTALASALGDRGALAGGVSTRTLGDGLAQLGVLLSTGSATAPQPSDALWLYAGGVLTALSPAARALTPGVPLLPATTRALVTSGTFASSVSACSGQFFPIPSPTRAAG